MPDIYLAAPLFSLAERNFNAKLARMLEDFGYSVFLPQRDCPQPKDSDPDNQDIFCSCVDGVDNCDIVIAILEGADHDSGASFEVGYAYAKQKSIIGVRTDFRKSGDTGGFNLMLLHACEHITDDIGKLESLVNLLKN